MATISDLRRGDKFVHAGVTYYAMDDARLTSEFSSLGDFCSVRLVKASGLTPDADGVIDLGMTMLDNKAVLASQEIRIVSRDHTLHHISEEIREGTPAVQPMSNLSYVMAARARAQREVDDMDEFRDILIRLAIGSGVRVAELAEKTGLSRERIYQIRDGRR